MPASCHIRLKGTYVNRTLRRVLAFSAVPMAGLVLAACSAGDPELKALAGKIKAEQQPEITMMAGWLTGWGQPIAQAGGHDMQGMGAMPGLMSDHEMQQLQAATGTDFDRMMIAHHNGAIQMAQQVQANGASTDVETRL
jgi:uncharacterized protein (DUF305 family)